MTAATARTPTSGKPKRVASAFSQSAAQDTTTEPVGVQSESVEEQTEPVAAQLESVSEQTETSVTTPAPETSPQTPEARPQTAIPNVAARPFSPPTLTPSATVNASTPTATACYCCN